MITAIELDYRLGFRQQSATAQSMQPQHTGASVASEVVEASQAALSSLQAMLCAPDQKLYSIALPSSPFAILHHQWLSAAVIQHFGATEHERHSTAK